MSIEQDYLALKEKLKSYPSQLEDSRDWLFVLANTMRAMIDNSDKASLGELAAMLARSKSQELKLSFDFCQGRFGRDGFSFRKHPRYTYLSSLVATYPEFVLTQEEKTIF
ncbi:hypothetical protein ACVRYP_05765 [Streptococcus rifensis]